MLSNQFLEGSSEMYESQPLHGSLCGSFDPVLRL